MSTSTKELLVSLSLANLCFFSPWLVLNNPSHYSYYFWKADPGFVESLSLLTIVLCFAVLIWLIAFLLRRGSKKWLLSLRRLLFFSLLIWPINSFLIDYRRFSLSGRLMANRWWLAVALMLLAILVVLVLRFQRQLATAAVTVLIIVSPLLLVNFGVALYLRIKHTPRPMTEINARSVARPAHANGPRVVWIVFDELQYNLVFANRPGGLKLQEFDRLRSESIFFTSAYPPSPNTITSIPALITGRLFKDALPLSVDELELVTTEGEKVRWSAEQNVFTEAAQHNFSSGIAGWYHPYCRVIGKDVDRCSWAPHVGEPNPVQGKLTFRVAAWENLGTSLLRVPLMFRFFRNEYEEKIRADHLGVLRTIETDADQLLRTKQELSFLHFPIPHGPWIGDGVNRTLIQKYLANVALSDRVLGKVRATLEEQGEWDNSVVIVTADHWWRDTPGSYGANDHRIPFMIKLAGQNTVMEYQTPINTVLTRELVIRLLRAELSRTSEVMEWIDRNSHQGESSITAGSP